MPAEQGSTAETATEGLTAEAHMTDKDQGSNTSQMAARSREDRV